MVNISRTTEYYFFGFTYDYGKVCFGLAEKVRTCS